MRRPRYAAPCACAASSSTLSPCLRAIASSSSSAAGWPYRCTGMIARVRGVGRHDHLVARADAEREQAQVQRIEPVRGADRVSRLARLCELAFERLDLGPEDVPAAAHDARGGRVELGLDAGVHRLQVEE